MRYAGGEGQVLLHLLLEAVEAILGGPALGEVNLGCRDRRDLGLEDAGGVVGLSEAPTCCRPCCRHNSFAKGRGAGVGGAGSAHATVKMVSTKLSADNERMQIFAAACAALKLNLRQA